MGAFCSLRFLAEMEWITFASVATLVSETFSVSLAIVNTLSSVFFFSYVVLAFPASWIFERFGLRAGLHLSAVLLFAGSWMRWVGALSPKTFWLMWSGQTVASLSQLFTLQSSSALAARWFGERERAAATSVGFVVGIAGNLLAFLLCPFVVTSRASLAWILLGQAVFSSAGLLLTAAVVTRSDPPTPPSPAAGLVHSASFDEGDFVAAAKGSKLTALAECWSAVRKIFASFGFNMTLISSSLVTATFWNYQTVAEQVLRPEGHTSREVGTFLAVMVAVGTVGTFVLGPIVDRTRRFQETMAILCALSAISLGGITVAARAVLHRSKAAALALQYAVHAVGGIAMVAVAPVSFELALEQTFPTPETYPNSILMIVANLLSFVTLFIIDALRSPLPTAMSSASLSSGEEQLAKRLPGLLFMAALMTAGFVVSLFVPRKYMRIGFEESFRKDQKESAEPEVGIQLDAIVEVAPVAVSPAAVIPEGKQ